VYILENYLGHKKKKIDSLGTKKSPLDGSIIKKHMEKKKLRFVWQLKKRVSEKNTISNNKKKI